MYNSAHNVCFNVGWCHLIILFNAQVFRFSYLHWQSSGKHVAGTLPCRPAPHCVQVQLFDKSEPRLLVSYVQYGQLQQLMSKSSNLMTSFAISVSCKCRV